MVWSSGLRHCVKSCYKLNQNATIEIVKTPCLVGMWMEGGGERVNSSGAYDKLGGLGKYVIKNIVFSFLFSGKMKGAG